MQSNDTISEVLMNEQVFQVSFNSIDCELEILILRVSKDVIQEASESYYELSHETTD